MVNNNDTDNPIDHSLIGKYAFNTREVKLQDLLHEDAELNLNLSRMHLTVQILRIITPQNGRTGNAYTRYQRGNQQQTNQFYSHHSVQKWKQIVLSYDDK